MNSAYATLIDTKARQQYDNDLRHMRQEIGTFDGRPVSAWQGGSGNITYCVCKRSSSHMHKSLCAWPLSVRSLRSVLYFII